MTLRTLATLILLGAPATATAAPDPGPPKYKEKHALVIGISTYDANIKVPYAVDDAVTVANILAERFGFTVRLLIDDNPRVPLSPIVPPPKIQKLTEAVLRQAIVPTLPVDKGIAAKSALLFYYTGHGRRLEWKGYVMPADSAGGGGTKNLLDFADIAKGLREHYCHHTLMILNCCHSGTALEESSGVRQAVEKVGPISEEPKYTFGDLTNLQLVFSRPAFQVITATSATGPELAGAAIEVEYVDATVSQTKKTLGYRGRSPFTAVLVQGLTGLTGLPDGNVLGSQLGYYASDQLVTEDKFKAFQKPQLRWIGDRGDGDFLFAPTGLVLDPKLVAPLYLFGSRYDEIHTSACTAMAASVLARTTERERLRLAQEAIPHLVAVVERAQQGRSAEAAAAALADLAEGFKPSVRQKGLSALRSAVGPLTRFVADRQAAWALRFQAARALGGMATLDPEIGTKALPDLAQLYHQALQLDVDERTDETVRNVVIMVDALRAFGLAAVPHFGAQLKEPVLPIVKRSADELARLGPGAAPAVPDLKAALSRVAPSEIVPNAPNIRPDPQAQSAALAIIDALAAIGPKAEGAVPVLVEVLATARIPGEHSGPGFDRVHWYGHKLTQAAARALVAVGPGAIPALRKLVADRTALRCWAAATALVQFGESAAPAIPELIDVFTYYGANEKSREALSPGGLLTPWVKLDPPFSLPGVHPWNIDQVFEGVESAIVAAGPAAIPLLEKEIIKARPLPRRWMARALVDLHYQTGRPVPTLAALRDDRDPMVRATLVSGASRAPYVDDAATAAVVMAASRDREPSVRKGAMTAIARMRVTGRVQDALANSLRDPFAPNVHIALDALTRADAITEPQRSALELMVAQPNPREPYGWQPASQAAVILFRLGEGDGVSLRLARDKKWDALLDVPPGPGRTAIMPYALADAQLNPRQGVTRRGSAVEVIRAYGDGADGSVPVLMALLRDTGDYRSSGPHVRRAALVRALGAVGSRGNSSVAADLIRILEEPDEVVWEAAVNALVDIGPRAVPTLSAALTSTETALKLPPPPPTGQPRGRNGRWDAVTERRFGAAVALALLAPSPQIVPILVTALSDPSDGKREVARTALTAAGRNPASTKAVVEALAEALKDGRQETLLAAAATVADIGSPARGTVPQLIEALAFPIPSVRVTAANALAEVGPGTAEALAALRSLLAERNLDVRLAAALAIVRSDPKDPAAEQVVFDELAGMNAHARPGHPFTTNSLRAISAVGDLAPIADRAVPALVSVLKSGGYTAHRAAAAEALVRVGSPALSAVIDSLSAADWLPAKPPGMAEIVSFFPGAPPDWWLLRDEIEGLSTQEAINYLFGRVPSPGPSYDDVRAAYPVAWLQSTPFGEMFDAVGGIPDWASLNKMIRSGGATVPQSDSRLAAAAVVGRIAAVDPATIPNIKAALSRPDPSPRFALASLGRSGSAAVPALRDAAKSLEPGVRLAAVRELARLGRPAVEALVSLLGTADPAVVMAAANELGIMGPDGEAVVRPLAQLLRAENPEVRFTAAWALGNLGPKAEGAVDALVTSLRDGSPDLRRAAAEALGFISVRTPQVADALITLLTDLNPWVRAAGVISLGKIELNQAQPRRARAVTSLIGLLKDPELAVRHQAVVTLGLFRSEAAPAVPELIALLKTSEPILVLVVLDALGEIGTEAAAAVPSLVAMAAEAYEEGQSPLIPQKPQKKPYLCRLRASAALARIGPAAIPETMKALKAAQGERRFLILVAELMGGPARDAVPTLIDILKRTEPPGGKPRPDEADQFSFGLGAGDYEYPLSSSRSSNLPYPYSADGGISADPQIPGRPPGKFSGPPKAVGPGTTPDWGIVHGDRVAAIRALAAIGPAAVEAVPALTAALLDEDAQIRREAAEALSRIGMQGASAVTALVTTLQPPDTKGMRDPARLAAYEGLLPFALDALGRIGPKSVAPLINGLSNPNPRIRFFAAKALGTSTFDPAAVTQGLAGALGDQEWAVRAEVARSLGKQGPAAADKVPRLISTLADGSWEVASAARYALVAIGDPAVACLVESLRVRRRRAAYTRLQRLGRGLEKSLARSVLIKCLQDQDDEVRAAAAGVLRELGAKAISLLDQLDSVRTKDVQLWVRLIAADSYDSVSMYVP